MATIKSYTDLEQSKRLAEILPIESADMYWELDKNCSIEAYNLVPLIRYSTKERKELFEKDKELIPCWGLASLLDVIPKCIDEFNVLRMDIGYNDFAIWYDEMGGKTNFGVNLKLPDITMASPIDACVEMILKLHEENLI